jgi:hypothetical protein
MIHAYSVRVVFDRALNHEDDAAGTPATSDAFTHEVEAENAVCALAAAVEGVHHQYHRVGRRFLSIDALKANLTLAEVNRLDETA